MADQIPDSTKSVTVTQADVTDADRAAVTAFHTIQIKRIIAGDKTLGDNRDVIEQAFARHRIEAEKRAMPAALPDPVKLAESFCATPLPETVSADLCATQPGEGRYGTNLMTVAEATMVLRHALSTLSEDAIRQGEGDIERAAKVADHYAEEAETHADMTDLGARVEMNWHVRAEALRAVAKRIRALATPAPAVDAVPAGEVERLREALTPSAATKAAYHGEFTFDVCEGVSDAGIELYRKVYVPWDTVKRIMAAISARASLSHGEGRK
ncbi:hypothetical protein ACWGNZ_07135 [Sphingomonas zeae]